MLNNNITDRDLWWTVLTSQPSIDIGISPTSLTTGFALVQFQLSIISSITDQVYSFDLTTLYRHRYFAYKSHNLFCVSSISILHHLLNNWPQFNISFLFLLCSIVIIKLTSRNILGFRQSNGRLFEYCIVCVIHVRFALMVKSMFPKKAPQSLFNATLIHSSFKPVLIIT